MTEPIGALEQAMMSASPAERRAMIQALLPTVERWIEASVDPLTAEIQDPAEALEWIEHVRTELVTPLAASVDAAWRKANAGAAGPGTTRAPADNGQMS